MQRGQDAGQRDAEDGSVVGRPARRGRSVQGSVVAESEARRRVETVGSREPVQGREVSRRVDRENGSWIVGRAARRRRSVQPPVAALDEAAVGEGALVRSAEVVERRDASREVEAKDDALVVRPAVGRRAVEIAVRRQCQAGRKRSSGERARRELRQVAGQIEAIKCTDSPRASGVGRAVETPVGSDREARDRRGPVDAAESEDLFVRESADAVRSQSKDRPARVLAASRSVAVKAAVGSREESAAGASSGDTNAVMTSRSCAVECRASKAMANSRAAVARVRRILSIWIVDSTVVRPR